MSTATQLQPIPLVAEDLRAQFARDGFLVLRNRIPHPHLQGVRDAITARVAAIRAELAKEGLCTPGPRAPFARNLCFAGHHVHRYGRSWTETLATPAVHDLHRSPGLIEALQTLLGPDIQGHRQFNLRPKLPGQDLGEEPWHQDAGHSDPHTTDDTLISAWIPLVPVEASNGCLQIIPGSHRLEAVGSETCPQEQEAKAEFITMMPGDILLMHHLVLRRSGENRSEGIRWSIDCRFFAPTSPHAAALSHHFPEPWMLTGPDPTPATTWTRWYQAA